MNILLKEAIQARRFLEITYEGSVYRVEPYCYGKVWTGQEALRAYVTDTTAGPVPKGWHLFMLGDLENFRVLPSSFDGTRTDFDAYDLAMFFIYCRIEKSSQTSTSTASIGRPAA